MTSVLRNVSIDKLDNIVDKYIIYIIEKLK